MMSKISEKYAIFVKAYRVDRNASKAAIAAGYAKAGAGVTGHRLLKNPKIRAEIERQDAELNEKLDLSVEWVVKRLMWRAGFDVRAFYHDDGTLREVVELDDETAYALQGVEIEKLYQHFGKGQAQDKGTLTKIKFADRDKALELLGRHLKMFTDKVEVSGMDELAQALAEARKRVASSAA